MKITRRTAIGSLVATVAGTVPAFAQAFPNKPVKIVVGFAAGGGTDFVARVLADALKDRWGQSVMVESRTGASGMLAAEQVVRSAPDGYTLLVSPQTSIAVAPQIFAKSPYDPLKDLTPITILTATPMLLVAHPSFPASTFAEFLAYVRANPGKVTFASGGIGSSPHMTSELLNMQLGLKAVHVPYRGEQPALADVMGNQVGVLFANIPVGHALRPGRQAEGARNDRADSARRSRRMFPRSSNPAAGDYRDRDLERALRSCRHGAGAGPEDLHRRQGGAGPGARCASA